MTVTADFRALTKEDISSSSLVFRSITFLITTNFLRYIRLVRDRLLLARVPPFLWRGAPVICLLWHLERSISDLSCRRLEACYRAIFCSPQPIFLTLLVGSLASDVLPCFPPFWLCLFATQEWVPIPRIVADNRSLLRPRSLPLPLHRGAAAWLACSPRRR
jgi:hypothetical protein